MFLCTTKAGSLECSSFVRRKPAAPSKSMAVWGIIFLSPRRRAAHFPLAGLRVTWVLGPCCARSGAAALLAAGECATMRAQAVLMTACRTAIADAVFFTTSSPKADARPSPSSPVGDRKRSRGVPWTASPKTSPGACLLVSYRLLASPQPSQKTCSNAAAAAQIHRIH